MDINWKPIAWTLEEIICRLEIKQHIINVWEMNELNKNRISTPNFEGTGKSVSRVKFIAFSKKKCKFSQTNRQGEKKNNSRPELNGLEKKNQWRKLRKTKVGSSKNSSKFMDFSQNWQNQNKKYRDCHAGDKARELSRLRNSKRRQGLQDFRCGNSSGREWCCIG